MCFIFPGIKTWVASKYVKKYQIYKGDNHVTITISSCCLTSGEYGPRSYLVNSNKIDLQTSKGNFSPNHGAPPGSKFIPTPNSYITDKVWNEMAPAFGKILWVVPVVNKYPDLWMEITIDGFGSNLEGDALKKFAYHKIFIVK